VFDSLGVEGHSDLWVVDASGGTPRQLTRGPGTASVPTFSHDGKGIYFGGGERAGRTDLYRLPFEGGPPNRPPNQLTRHGGSYPQESADGRTVYYLRGSDLWRIPAAGGDEQPLGIRVWGNAYYVASDGIYFVAPNGEEDHRTFEIRFYDPATRAQRGVQTLGNLEVVNHGRMAVSPDHKTFLFTSREGTGADVMLVENFR
jgi:dipeptidyl aminopeptidase/acylaminoacyl peptidase